MSHNLKISGSEKITAIEIYLGVEALQDKRGKRKAEDQMSEVEKLRGTE